MCKKTSKRAYLIISGRVSLRRGKPFPAREAALLPTPPPGLWAGYSHDLTMRPGQAGGRELRTAKIRIPSR